MAARERGLPMPLTPIMKVATSCMRMPAPSWPSFSDPPSSLSLSSSKPPPSVLRIDSMCVCFSAKRSLIAKACSSPHAHDTSAIDRQRQRLVDAPFPAKEPAPRRSLSEVFAPRLSRWCMSMCLYPPACTWGSARCCRWPGP